jgi:hypothetical protein
LQEEISSTAPAPSFENESPTNLFSEINTPPLKTPVEEEKNLALENSTPFETTSSEIDKIVIFYKNGTFKDYKPAK